MRPTETSEQAVRLYRGDRLCLTFNRKERVDGDHVVNAYGRRQSRFVDQVNAAIEAADAKGLLDRRLGKRTIAYYCAMSVSYHSLRANKQADKEQLHKCVDPRDTGTLGETYSLANQASI